MRQTVSGGRQAPEALLFLLDVLLAGAVLCVFALFHHVLPQRLSTAQAASGASASLTVADAAIPADAGAEAAVQPSAADAVQDRFANMFSSGATVSTGTSYKSANVSVTLRSYTAGDAVYHVEEIYLRDVACLRTAFAGDAYGKGLREHPLDIAVSVGAVCAINGDYYGTSADNGVVIRNGVLYRDKPTNDVLVLYTDGSMRVFAKTAFDGETEMANGAWQAWCFGPSLLDADGKAVTKFSTGTHLAKDNPRTVIGCYAPGHYCFLTVDGRSDESNGMTMQELAALCEELGLTVAYNLDGGRTSVMTFGSAVVNDPDAGGRDSSDIIYICEIGEQA